MAETHLFSSSLRPSSGHDANMSLVRFAFLRSRGSRGGRAAAEDISSRTTDLFVAVELRLIPCSEMKLSEGNHKCSCRQYLAKSSTVRVSASKTKLNHVHDICTPLDRPKSSNHVALVAW